MVATQFMRIKFKQDRQDEKIKGEMGKGEKDICLPPFSLPLLPIFSSSFILSITVNYFPQIEPLLRRPKPLTPPS